MSIIPHPFFMKEHSGEFHLTASTSILTDQANQKNAVYLHNMLAPSSGFSLPVENQKQNRHPSIILNTNHSLSYLGNEGYQLFISPDEIKIEGIDPAGVFYGIQSLRQLLPAEIEEHRFISGMNLRVKCISITDKPRFTWRGFMLDEGRHFQGKQIVLQTIELMALLKLNVFHWHLTEDQGWRIEIMKHPRLTEIGSKRAGTSYGFFSKKHNGIPHTGFYSQAEIHEIAAYAAERHITIVPEIEMPGHSLAALAAYPRLSCTKEPYNVATHFGIKKDIYCAGKEEVYIFLEEILNEVMELFPSKYIHIGGDEAPKKRWKECKDCNHRIQQEGLKNTQALQLYFINRMADYLESNGRNAIVWNDMLRKGLHANIAVQYWARGRKQMIREIQDENRNTIMSSYLDTYLDHSYGLLPLSRAYHFEPLPKQLESKEVESIMGLEFPLWTEWVNNKARLDYQVYPRLTAMAETGWTSNDGKNLSDFQRRLDYFQKRLDKIGVVYASLREAEPSKIKQVFGIFSIPIPQTKIAELNPKQSAIL